MTKEAVAIYWDFENLHASIFDAVNGSGTLSETGQPASAAGCAGGRSGGLRFRHHVRQRGHQQGLLQLALV